MTVAMMRHRMAVGAVILAISALALAFASTTRAQNEPEFFIELSGANERPTPADTDAIGTFAAVLHDDNTLEFSLEVAGNGETLTMGHIHLGGVDDAGPVVVPLFMEEEGVDSVELTGTVTEADLINDLAGDWDAFEEALAAGLLYVNVHSVDYPAGVIRAQLVGDDGMPTPTASATATTTATPGETMQYTCSLSGAAERPNPADSDAMGTFTATLDVDNDTLTYDLEAMGHGQVFTMGHLHAGTAEEAGPVVVPLFMGEELQDIDMSGTVTADDLIDVYEGDWDAFEDAFIAGAIYVNLHSVEFPAGVIRCTPALAGVPTPTGTTTPTASPTETVTATAAPTDTSTPMPTATPTRVVPRPPDTGTGNSDGGFPVTPWMVIVLAGAGVLFAASTAVAVRRR